MPRPRTRDDELAAKISASAFELARAGGVAAITTRRAAAGAETNIAALNQLFGGHAGLVDAVALRGFDLLAHRMRRHASTDPGIARLTGYAVAFREFARSEPGLVETMFARPIRSSTARDTGAVECRERLLTALTHVVPGASVDSARHLAIGLTALLEGLALKERNGLLGADTSESDRIWERSVAAFLDGASR